MGWHDAHRGLAARGVESRTSISALQPPITIYGRLDRGESPWAETMPFMVSPLEWSWTAQYCGAQQRQHTRNSQRVWLGLACFLGGSCDELPLVLGRLLLFRPPPELERVPAYPQGARVHAHPAGRPVPGIQSAMETRGLLRQLCVCIAPWRRLDQGLSGIIMNKYKRVCSTTSKPDTSCDDVRYRWPSKCIQDTSKAARARGKATARHRSGEMRWESGA